MIIDEFTGRILEGRRWSEGLHQAVEAKEGVAIGEENQTLATITLQNYFRLYDKLAGHDRHGAHRGDRVHEDLQSAGRRDPDQPPDGPGRPATTRSSKPRTASGRPCSTKSSTAKKGQPILVGTVSVEVSEMISGRAEAAAGSSTPSSTRSPSTPNERVSVIAQAGRKGAVMIATNMAGRGVDIKLGGDPEQLGDPGAEEAGHHARAGGIRGGAGREGGGDGAHVQAPRPRRCASWAASSSAAPSATSRGASTTSCAAARAARATPARRASSSPPKTTSSASSPATASTKSSTNSARWTRRATRCRSRRKC